MTSGQKACILVMLINQPVQRRMMMSQYQKIKNNPQLKGSLAGRKVLFGEHGRYAVAPVHTRFDDVEWFVWDAQHPLSDMNHAEVIRQASTYEDAVAGL